MYWFCLVLHQRSAVAEYSGMYMYFSIWVNLEKVLKWHMAQNCRDCENKRIIYILDFHTKLLKIGSNLSAKVNICHRSSVASQYWQDFFQ